MSRHEYNRIRLSLAPFIRLMLAIAMLGLLASCGGGSGTITNSDPVIPPTGTTTRTVTAQDIATGEVTGREYAAGELLIYLKSLSDQAVFVDFIKEKKWTVVAYYEPLNRYTVQTNAKDEASLISYSSELKNISYIKRVNFNGVSMGPKSRTTDPSWLEDAKSWNLNAINLSEARDLISNYALSTDINVGIVDSKFTSSHEDIKFKTVIVDDGTSSPPTYAGGGVRGGRESANIADHGMHVSGIIGSLQNSKGTVGIAPTSSLNAYDPYNKNGFALDESIESAIWELKGSGNKIINLSLGTSICTQATGKCSAESKIFPFSKDLAVRSAIDKIYQFTLNSGDGNILFVQSSGNDGGNYFNKNKGEIGNASDKIYADHNGYVATALSLKLENDTTGNYGDMQRKIAEHSLIVGAFVSNNGVKSITDYTMVPSANAELLSANFILAPGGDTNRGVYSTVLPGWFDSGEYDYMNGTSMAAPHVSGVAALLLQINPKLKSWEIKNLILANSDTVSGYRSLNAEKAVRAAIETLSKPTATISIITPSPLAGSGVIFEPNITASPNGGVTEFEWDFGDGTIQIGTAGQISHTYNSGGSYTVKLKIKDVKGVTNTTTVPVTVAGVSVPAIASISPATATAGEVTTFAIAGTNLPTSRQLDITFNGCANIAVILKSMNLHKFTCTPQGEGTITVDIRATAGGTILKSQQVTVIPVASPTTRYTYSTDGTEVIDSQTGLIWRRCAEGMVWSGVNCTGVASRLTFDQAALYATSQSSNNKLWRVPNINELEGIIMTVPSSPTSSPIDATAFPSTPLDRFWSSSTHVNYLNNAWYGGFYYSGFTSYTSTSESNPIRLVR